MNVLIAEDESRAREGLKQMIPADIADVYTAANGLEALELASKIEPDVALCDVRMPKMDGIELAKRLRSTFPNIHIMFISAYSDKEYLKSAIYVHADGYLEKPIDETELLDYLRRTARQIHDNAQNRPNSNNVEDPFSRQQLFYALINDKKQEQISNVNPHLIREVFNAESYLSICLYIQWPDSSAAVHYTSYSSVDLSGLLRSISSAYLFAPLSDRQIGILFYGNRLPACEECCEKLLPLLEALRCANPQARNICACVGEQCHGVEKISECYRAAYSHARWMCFVEKTSCEVEALPTKALVSEDRSAEFESLLNDHKLAEAKQLIHNQTASLMGDGTGSIDEVRRYYELLLDIALRMNDIRQYKNLKKNRENLLTFSKLTTLTELSRFICARIDDIAPTLNIDSNASTVIHVILDYIRSNVDNPSLSVQSIADHVGLNTNYLSTVFKKETGRNLHNVIVDIRIEHAKYLLLNAENPGKVSERCGFTSVRYFYSVFKKYTGMSPTAFIEQYHRKTDSDYGVGSNR